MKPWDVCFGIETEYGIAVDEEPDADVVEESIQLVRAARDYGLPHLWDYGLEDPHVDARGFRAAELLQDTDEANFFSRDAQREYSFQEIKSDLVLRNGARFYNDHAHPEYSTPECGTVRELVAQDKAGERILAACAKAVGAATKRTVRLYKNNTDYLGHSYGCHDNYLVARAVPWDDLVAAMTPFLVTRQIYAGAGKVGWECEDSVLTAGAGFQIAQRSDFFTELVSIDTMNRRPIINTRDEPHAEAARYRRFHVIIGDANLCEFATWLKIGATALVLEALQHPGATAFWEDWELDDPLLALREISRDQSHGWAVELAGRRRSDAVELQLAYADAVGQILGDGLAAHEEKAAVLAAWRETLEQLRRDPLALHDRLDWVAKLNLLEQFRATENLPWSDPWLQSLDLQYHLVDREDGLYDGLVEAGAVRREVDEEEIRTAVSQPPASSRAYLRGKCIQRFAAAIKTAQWDHIVFQHKRRTYRLDLNQAFPGREFERLRDALDQAPDLDAFLRAIV
ncbi:MAG: proteasome accessory factor PafA2 family protein [Verrucomicrobiota bacterium]